MVGDLVGDRPEQEPLGAGHPLVPDHDQVDALLLGDIEDRVRRITLTRVACSFRDARAPRVRAGPVEQREYVGTRVDGPFDVGGNLRALELEPLIRGRLVRADDLELGP